MKFFPVLSSLFKFSLSSVTKKKGSSLNVRLREFARRIPRQALTQTYEGTMDVRITGRSRNWNYVTPE